MRSSSGSCAARTSVSLSKGQRGSGWAAAIALLLCLPVPALAQSLNLDLAGSTGSSTAKVIQLVLLITVISLAPSILVMVTAFTRIIVVLSFLRTAIGAQSTPPNQVIVSLALFLTAFVMMPTFTKSWTDGIQPLIEERMEEGAAIQAAAEPFRTFMLSQVKEKELSLFAQMMPGLKIERAEETPYQVLIPAFMVHELKRAFEIGFLLFVPFLVIDMVVSSILMAMGMMMLPPVVISLPFKLIFFVLVDGWYLVSGGLVKSFGGISGL